MRTYVWFTYGRDALKLRASVQGVRHFDSSARAVVYDDDNNPLSFAQRANLRDMGVEVEGTLFPRRGNLRGRKCVGGMWEKLCLYDGEVIKLDSDVLILGSLSKAPRGNLVRTRRLTRGRNVFGGFYALSPGALREIKRRKAKGELDALLSTMPALIHEDLFVRRMVKYWKLSSQGIHNTGEMTWWSYRAKCPLSTGHKIIVPTGPTGRDKRWLGTMRRLLDEAGVPE